MDSVEQSEKPQVEAAAPMESEPAECVPAAPEEPEKEERIGTGNGNRSFNLI